MANELMNLGSAKYGDLGWAPINDITEISRGADKAFVGSMSLKIDHVGNTNSQEVRGVQTPEGEDAITIDPNKDVTASFWCSYSSVFPIYSRFIWFDDSGGEIDRSDDEATPSPNPGTTDWRQVVMTRTPPAEARKAALVIEKDRSPVMYVDAVTVNQEGITDYVPSLRVREDIDVRLKIAAKDWDRAVNQQLLNIGGEFALETVSGNNQLSVSYGASAETGTHTLVDKEFKWLRFTVKSDVGADNHTVTYRSSVDGTSWSTYATVTQAGIWQLDTLDDGTVRLGADEAGASGFIGAVNYLEIRDGLDGPVLLALDADSWPSGSTTYQLSTLHTAELISSPTRWGSEILDRSALGFSTDEETVTVDHNEDVSITKDGDYIFLVGQFFGMDNGDVPVGHQGLTATSGWQLHAGSSNLGVSLTNAANLDFTTVLARSWKSIGFHYSGDDQVITLLLDGDRAATLDFDGSLEDLENLENVIIQGSKFVSWIAVFQRDLADSQLAQLKNWDGKMSTEPGYMRSSSSFYFNVEDEEARSAYHTDGSLLNLAGGGAFGATVWEPFVARTTTFEAIVDENGPWRNGEPASAGSSSVLASYDSLTRDDFGIPSDDSHVVTSIEAESSNSNVEVWVDESRVGSEGVVESYENGTYIYSTVPVRAQVSASSNNPKWLPQVHAGHLFRGEEEFYLYADKMTESVSSDDEIILENTARQGAPVVVLTEDATPSSLVQVSFFDEDLNLTLTNTEVVRGTGAASLYLSYPDVTLLAVADEEGNAVANSGMQGSSNEVVTDDVTSREKNYTVTYVVNGSFFVDHDYVDEDGNQRSRVVMDAVGDYTVTYEQSIYNAATPVSVALNTVHTTQHEGFLYVAFDDHDLASIRVHVSPGTILADGEDYVVITIESLDVNGNPKPDQNFTIATDFGTLSAPSVTTDQDGHASLVLTASDEFVDDTATITISGGVSASFDIEVQESSPREPVLHATVKVTKVEAGTENANLVFGRIVDTSFVGVAGATVTWKKARSIYELFNGGEVSTGTATTDADGIFTIGPIDSADEIGYWFMSTEATVSGVEIGDVVHWYEFADISKGVENLLSVQQATPAETHPPGGGIKTTVTYREDDEKKWVEATPDWIGPPWYQKGRDPRIHVHLV